MFRTVTQAFLGQKSVSEEEEFEPQDFQREIERRFMRAETKSYKFPRNLSNEKNNNE